MMKNINSHFKAICTVWNFHDFTISQILREIIFGDYRSAKSAILTHLEALKFDFLRIIVLFEG